MTNHPRSRGFGFTVIEFLMCLAIALIIAAIALPNYLRTRPGKEFACSGIVRNVWAQGRGTAVTIEHDTGEMTVINFCNQPALWAGERFAIKYSSRPFDEGRCDWFISATREAGR